MVVVCLAASAASFGAEGNAADSTTATARVSTGVLAISAKPANRIAPAAALGEKFTSFTLEPGVRITVQGTATSASAATPPHVIFYLLPNGNTTEQAFGRTASPGLDWHYNIQHIAAQTRRVQQLLGPRPVVTAVVEADTLSWPTWRRVTPDADKNIAALVDEILKRATAEHNAATTATFDLVAHSGGGSFIWGYLNAHDQLPSNLEHIAFIDANYSYSDDDHHGEKLLRWLQSSPSHQLIVLAYDDRRVTIDGKPIVSETGGTWRATDRMARRLEQELDFTSGTINDLQSSTALAGRVTLARHPNPDNKILHTVLVEKNGFVFSAASMRMSLPRDDMPFAAKETYRSFILP